MKKPHHAHTICRLTVIALASLPQLGCVSELEHDLHRYDGHAEAVQTESEVPSTEFDADTRQVSTPPIATLGEPESDTVTEQDDPSMADASTTSSTPASPAPAQSLRGDAAAPSKARPDAPTTFSKPPTDAASPASSKGSENGECDAGTCGSNGESDSATAPEGECSSQPCASELGGIGATCADSDECASSRCLDGTCAELDLAISSEGVEEQDFLLVHFVIERGTAAVNWEDLAFLYFFTPEVHYDFRTAYDNDSESTRLCVEVDTDLWAYVWRSSKVGPVQWLETSFSAQVHDETWTPMINANDYSYAAAAGPNPNVIVCRQTGTQWVHVQGNVPPDVGDPCWVVEPDCSHVSCDDPTQ